jgi:hypothetical protein
MKKHNLHWGVIFHSPVLCGASLPVRELTCHTRVSLFGNIHGKTESRVTVCMLPERESESDHVSWIQVSKPQQATARDA